MAERRVFTLSQVAQHKSKKDCWFVINGRVLDVTKFLDEHPGGEEVLIEAAGKDATKEFEDIGHSKAAQNMLVKYQVGVLQGYKVQGENASAAAATSYKESKGKEMSAFVIKEDGLPKFKSFIEFFVPLIVAGGFFGYRYLTMAA
ncbi:cytochrome b5-like [Telopea speciosissima]|uniref:cytochrome b5-like n=1 Tax=Telopea speciosissima TaxID=54955 RepID=UPI001CC6B337|nr:cytochrome b5-like [Telopea speciosissima]